MSDVKEGWTSKHDITVGRDVYECVHVAGRAGSIFRHRSLPAPDVSFMSAPTKQ